MSKSRHRKRIPAACPGCSRKHKATPAALLSNLATALNALGDAGRPARLKHGIVACRDGYVLPLTDGTWVARTLTYTPFSPPDDDDDG